MKKYEIMFIVRPDIEASLCKKTFDEMEKILTSNKAKIILAKEKNK